MINFFPFIFKLKKNLFLTSAFLHHVPYISIPSIQFGAAWLFEFCISRWIDEIFAPGNGLRTEILRPFAYPRFKKSENAVSLPAFCILYRFRFVESSWLASCLYINRLQLFSVIFAAMRSFDLFALLLEILLSKSAIPAQIIEYTALRMILLRSLLFAKGGYTFILLFLLLPSWFICGRSLA